MLDSLVNTIVLLGTGPYRRHRVTDALLGLNVQRTSDFRKIPVATLQRCLSKTLICCPEIREHYPQLERQYRLRRRWFAASAVMLASGHLHASSQELVDSSVLGRMAFRRRNIPLLQASSLRLWGCLLRAVLALAPKGPPRRMDDECVRVVLAFLGEAKRVAARLDRENAVLENQRRAWTRLEVGGNWESAAESPRMLEVKQQLQWSCPTRVSALIYLSMLRDNNTGMYRHPALSTKFGAMATSQMLSRIHREICEELLDYPFPEIVREIESYASQTRADEVSFLTSWKNIRAYRIARPAELDVFTSCFFEFTLDLAVAALETRR